MENAPNVAKNFRLEMVALVALIVGIVNAHKKIGNFYILLLMLKRLLKPEVFRGPLKIFLG